MVTRRMGPEIFTVSTLKEVMFLAFKNFKELRESRSLFTSGAGSTFHLKYRDNRVLNDFHPSILSTTTVNELI